MAKYGVKKLKRKQAVKLLNYIYDETHPHLKDVPDPQIRKNTGKGPSSSENADERKGPSVENKHKKESR